MSAGKSGDRPLLHSLRGTYVGNAWRSILVVLPVAGFACLAIPRTSGRGPDSPLTRIRLEDQETRGISGLTREPDGTLWAVGERDHLLLELSESDGRILSRRTIEGVGHGIDLESVAWLGDSRIALGTEASGDGRATDPIYIAEIGEREARVVSRIELPYDRWGQVSRSNSGIEGLCHAGSTLLAGVEITILRNGKRLAPLGVYDLEHATWTPLWLALTSESGKLSALDCRVDGDGIDVLAVERHYVVARLLRFVVPLAGASEPITPEIVLDLAAFKRFTDNFEGIVRIDDDFAALILDNDSGGISSANALIRVALRWSASDPEENALPQRHDP